MKRACIQYLTERLEQLTGPDGVSLRYRAAADVVTGAVQNTFFLDLPRDFLKDNDYAVCCLPLQDRIKPYGKLIGKQRLADKSAVTLTRRRFTRDVLFRCLLYAPNDAELWGTANQVGMVDKFIQDVTEHKWLIAGDNSAIRVEPQEPTRPWDSAAEDDRKLRRPRLAIVRVLFSGGVQTQTTQAFIPSFTITPSVVDNPSG